MGDAENAQTLGLPVILKSKAPFTARPSRNPSETAEMLLLSSTTLEMCGPINERAPRGNAAKKLDCGKDVCTFRRNYAAGVSE